MGKRFSLIDVLLALAVLLLVYGIAGNARGDSLPYAVGPHWRTVGYFVSQPNATAPVQVSFTNCSGFGPLPSATVKPGGVAKLDAFVCGSDSFGLIPADGGMSKLTYDDGANRAEFTVTPLAEFRISQAVLFDGGSTWATIFCSAATPLTARWYDAANPFVFGFEYFECAPPVSQYHIKQSGLGTFRVEIGYAALLSRPDLPPIHGFVTQTDDKGFGNGSVTPLSPVRE